MTPWRSGARRRCAITRRFPPRHCSHRRSTRRAPPRHCAITRRRAITQRSIHRRCVIRWRSGARRCCAIGRRRTCRRCAIGRRRSPWRCAIRCRASARRGGALSRRPRCTCRTRRGGGCAHHRGANRRLAGTHPRTLRCHTRAYHRSAQGGLPCAGHRGALHSGACCTNRRIAGVRRGRHDRRYGMRSCRGRGGHLRSRCRHRRVAGYRPAIVDELLVSSARLDHQRGWPQRRLVDVVVTGLGHRIGQRFPAGAQRGPTRSGSR